MTITAVGGGAGALKSKLRIFLGIPKNMNTTSLMAYEYHKNPILRYPPDSEFGRRRFLTFLRQKHDQPLCGFY